MAFFISCAAASPPRRAEQLTLNMAGLSGRAETRSAAPAWLDAAGQGDGGDAFQRPWPAPTRAAPGTSTSLNCILCPPIPQPTFCTRSPPAPPRHPPTRARRCPPRCHTPAALALPTGHGAFISLCPRPPLLVILNAFRRMLSGFDVVWLGCLFSYWRFYDRVGNEP